PAPSYEGRFDRALTTPLSPQLSSQKLVAGIATHRASHSVPLRRRTERAVDSLLGRRGVGGARRVWSTGDTRGALMGGHAGCARRCGSESIAGPIRRKRRERGRAHTERASAPALREA